MVYLTWKVDVNCSFLERERKACLSSLLASGFAKPKAEIVRALNEALFRTSTSLLGTRYLWKVSVGPNKPLKSRAEMLPTFSHPAIHGCTLQCGGERF